MSKQIYTPVDELTSLQYQIMVFVDWWVRNKKIPVPQKEIIKEMEKKKIKSSTTWYAISQILHKGYIRRALTFNNRTSYVQLRNIEI